MSRLIFILIISSTLVSCKEQGVNFSPSESTKFEMPKPQPFEEELPTPVAPQIIISQKPSDHALGESTSAVYKVVAGSHSILSVLCLVDGDPIDCSETGGKIHLKKFGIGKHQVQIDVEDDQGLKGQAAASWKVFKHYQEKVVPVTVEDQPKKSDILFIIDNSISMQEEQIGIAKKIHRFFGKLKDLDWRIGIITTDPYSTHPKSHEFNPLADGSLLQFPNGQYQLDNDLSLNKARKLFAATIFRHEQGNGHERGIHNLWRAIERSSKPKTLADAHLFRFFRSEAALSVVVISDEDETFIDGRNNPLPHQYKSSGENLIKFVQHKWGQQKLFQFSSIIVKPGDHSCIVKNERFGYAYHNLSRLTGGVVGNICAKDYGSILKAIGAEVANLQKVYKLSCAPIDSDKDGRLDFEVISLSGQSVPPYTLNGKQVEFRRGLKPGEYRFRFRCGRSVSK